MLHRAPLAPTHAEGVNATLHTSRGGLSQGCLRGLTLYENQLDLDTGNTVTERQLKNLVLAGLGYDHPRIGALLDRTPSLVASDMKLAYRKLGARNLRHAVRRLFETEVAIVTAREDVSRLPVPTPRELFMLEQVSTGSSQPEIADANYVTVETVKSTLSDVTHRFDMVGHRTAGLLLRFYANGLLAFSPDNSVK